MIKISGFGKAVPKKTIHNNDLAKIGDTNDEWITSRTGISYRHIISGDESLSSLMVKASKKAIGQTNITSEEIDLIICATFTPTNICPNAACYVKRQIGASKAVAFDINSACSGFIYATWVAQNLMKAEGYKNALVIGGDALSKVTNWEDRSTFVLFGDGCGAVTLSYDNKLPEERRGDILSPAEGILAIEVQNHDDVSGSLCVTGINTATPFEPHEETKPHIIMNGKNVFKFATNAFADMIGTLCKKANIEINDIDYFVPHQANARIIDHVANKMDIPLEKFFKNIDKYGNTSAGSVPIALAELVEEKKPKKGSIICSVAFGGGLTAGGLLFEI